MLFKDKYFFLSNFFECQVKIEIEGKKFTFKNAEAAFHAQKDPALAENFCFLSGLEAKKIAEKSILPNANWKVDQLYAMAKVLNAKFRNTYLLLMLKCIKDDIVNDNYWKDTFWGVCKGEGYNVLGKMLMNIRDHDNDYGQLLAYINRELIKYAKL